MPFSILLPVYGHNFGVIYYLAMQALALRRLTCEAGHRLFLVRRAGEQFPGLREKLEREFQPEELLEIGDDDAGLAPIAERIVHDHGPLVAHVQGARQLRSLISLKKAQPKQLQLVYSVHSFSNGTWRAMPFTWIVSRLLRRHVDYTIFHTPFAIERFTGSGKVFADGRAGLMPLGLEASFARPEADSAAPKIDDRFRRLLDDDDTFRFIYLAVLSHGKGQAWLQEQMARCSADTEAPI